MMPAGLRRALIVTDVLVLLYWIVTALAVEGLLAVPSAALYRHDHDPVMVAWNWSFAPLDIAFALIGLFAVRSAGTGRPWRGLAIVSLVLAMGAGGMAIAFWTLTGDFAALWWLPNLVLLGGPLIWLPGLVRDAE